VGASEGGGRLLRAGGATLEEAASLGLGRGLDGPTLVRLTCGLGIGLTVSEQVYMCAIPFALSAYTNYIAASRVYDFLLRPM
jgi:hypothetical protein